MPEKGWIESQVPTLGEGPQNNFFWLCYILSCYTVGDRACPHYLMPNREPLSRRSEKSDVCGVILIVMWEEDACELSPCGPGSEWAGLSEWILGTVLVSLPDSWEYTSYFFGQRHTFLIRHHLSNRILDDFFASCFL